LSNEALIVELRRRIECVRHRDPTDGDPAVLRDLVKKAVAARAKLNGMRSEHDYLTRLIARASTLLIGR